MAKLRQNPLYAPNGVVIAGTPASAQAGIDALQEGGTAVDAALCALLTELLASGPGQGGRLTAQVWVNFGIEHRSVSIEAGSSEQLVDFARELSLDCGSRSLDDLIPYTGADSALAIASDNLARVAWSGTHESPAPIATAVCAIDHRGVIAVLASHPMESRQPFTVKLVQASRTGTTTGGSSVLLVGVGIDAAAQVDSLADDLRSALDPTDVGHHVAKILDDVKLPPSLGRLDAVVIDRRNGLLITFPHPGGDGRAAVY